MLRDGNEFELYPCRREGEFPESGPVKLHGVHSAEYCAWINLSVQCHGRVSDYSKLVELEWADEQLIHWGDWKRFLYISKAVAEFDCGTRDISSIQPKRLISYIPGNIKY